MFGRIAAGLEHDISHPIQNIGNSCKLILKLGDDADYRATFRRTVDREFSSIKRVLDDLRNLARPMPLERFPADVNRAIQDTVDAMEPLAATAGLTLNSRLGADPLYVEGDLFARTSIRPSVAVSAWAWPSRERSSNSWMGRSSSPVRSGQARPSSSTSRKPTAGRFQRPSKPASCWPRSYPQHRCARLARRDSEAHNISAPESQRSQAGCDSARGP